MATLAFIPVRGGSQSIPLKNIKEINGKPLIYWTLVSLQNCPQIDRIVVSTDSRDIKNCALSFGLDKVTVFDRSNENAQNHSSTESAMLEYISAAKLKKSDTFVLVQATNPFTTEADFTAALKIFKSNKTARSLLSVVRTKRFFWDLKNKPLNYDPAKRPRRQDYDGLLMENGAFYISKIGDIVKSKNRLTKPIITYEMPEHSGFEIDEPDDWIICSELLKRHRGSENASLQSKTKKIKLFLSDVDGVLTDAGMYYSENGDELKKFNTYDGMGFKLIQQMGIQVGILTAEDRDLNRRRAEKLKLNHDFHGVSHKLERLTSLLQELQLSFDQVAYVGDDLNDIEVLRKVGLAFCPASAQPEVLKIPGIIQLESVGGNGVIREIYRFLKSQH